MRRRWRWTWWHTAAVTAAVAVAVGVAQSGSSKPSPAPSGLGVACGKERWDVKTLADPAASSVNLTPVDTTVAALRALPAPVNPVARTDGEKQVVRVHATVFAYKTEADSDVHLGVKDAQGSTMIFEIPDPACVNDSFKAQIAQARSTWDSAHPSGVSFTTGSWPVTVTGVVFFDRSHGQLAVAPNAVEVHPVLSITLGG